MELSNGASSCELWLLLLPAAARSPFLASAVFVLLAMVAMAARWSTRGGAAWWPTRNTIPGPRGLPLIGSLLDMGGALPHRKLAAWADHLGAVKLMSLSLGATRLVVASDPSSARELLGGAAFADRPLKQSAQQLLFGRAIGFAPHGDYWRRLRRIAASHLFSPKRIAAFEHRRQAEASVMLSSMLDSSQRNGGAAVEIRRFLQRASLNNVMQSVFGRRYDFASPSSSGEAAELQAMVREGFELLGAFNWADHLPALKLVDPQAVHQRAAVLVPKVSAFVQRIIDEHRAALNPGSTDSSDFVDVLLGFKGEEKLADEDMIAILWEMIFRGTDTTAILCEWILAELVLHPGIQQQLHNEVVSNTTGEVPSEADTTKMALLNAVVKETLRLHPPGPLLSWARLATEDTIVAGHSVPKGTTAMVNMWYITHNPAVWSNPSEFRPSRFLPGGEAGAEFDIKGTDLRLAPFGAGRRVCPGRALGLATVNLWLARIVHRLELRPDPASSPAVDMSEVLKLSCEMVKPLRVVPVDRHKQQQRRQQEQCC